MCETNDYILLLSIEKLTETKLYVLLEHFRTPRAIMNASRKSLADLAGEEVAGLVASLVVDGSIKEKCQEAEKLRIRAVPYYSSDYPGWLKSIDHFPPVLFMRGSIQASDEMSVAIVGTRGATVYGKSIADNFARDFVLSGITVVSGMARGIDTTAHWSALRNHGRTIAVLGCGLDRAYPPENRALMEEITKQGAVISEFTVGTPPRAQNFPKRNRIISGLSRAIVAIEAKEKSGVMNTVNWASNQNKDVFAIPGNIYSKTSSGTNQLIKDGAIPVTSAHEVMEMLRIDHAPKGRLERTIILKDDERIIWDALSADPVFLDELSERLGLATPALLKTLLALEIKGLVRQLPGMMFVKNPV